MNYKDPSIIDVKLMDEKARSIYFHDMAEGSRSLELLLCTCYNNGVIPSIASKGHGNKSLAYIILCVAKENLNTIGRLIDLVEEIPDCEFNIRTQNHEKLYAELSCDSKDNDQLFTRIKEIIEESRIDTNKNHNYTLMMTIYNIAKIIGSIIEADLLFATNEKLYAQGKCGISFYQGKQINRISSKKIDNIQDVIKELKENATLNLPTVFFCTFEELRTFYFELDEVVYGQDEYQGDQNG